MKQKLTAARQADLIKILKARFEKHQDRHPGIEWSALEARLNAHIDKLWSLQEMEASEGEPDVIGVDNETGEILFVDCSPESPKGRRSLCYDQAALDARKEAKPDDSAMNVAAAMGIELLTEAQYRELQRLGKFDEKTSSWIVTPPAIRKLGGSLFCDRRYDTVFTYHNGASSYYAARGFRGMLRI